MACSLACLLLRRCVRTDYNNDLSSSRPFPSGRNVYMKFSPNINMRSRFYRSCFTEKKLSLIFWTVFSNVCVLYVCSASPRVSDCTAFPSVWASFPESSLKNVFNILILIWSLCFSPADLKEPAKVFFLLSPTIHTQCWH